MRTEELRGVYTSPIIIRQIKSQRMRLARNMTRILQKKNACRTLGRKPAGKKQAKNGDDNIKLELK
jgi:hypothetical protein